MLNYFVTPATPITRSLIHEGLLSWHGARQGHSTSFWALLAVLQRYKDTVRRVVLVTEVSVQYTTKKNSRKPNCVFIKKPTFFTHILDCERTTEKNWFLVTIPVGREPWGHRIPLHRKYHPRYRKSWSNVEGKPKNSTRPVSEKWCPKISEKLLGFLEVSSMKSST